MPKKRKREQILRRVSDRHFRRYLPEWADFLFTETQTRPAFFLGTSSDRIGSPSGEQSYFATVSKYIPRLRSSFYGSLNYSEWDGKFNVTFGVGFELGKGFSLRPMYDGDQRHVMLNYFTAQYGVSLLYVWLETMDISLSLGF